MEELSRSVSVVLQNAHVPMTSIKPNVPGVIDVGGVHIAPPKPLPEDLQKFSDEATNGVIYLSFGKHADSFSLTYLLQVFVPGSHLKSKDIPPAELAIFMQVFEEFGDVRVLWKYEADDVDQMPKNVLARKWMPQNDVLAHPNVKMFITHNGLLSSQEGLHHGVPMLGIPFFADQLINTHRAVVQGYALQLDFPNITVDSLRWAFNELLYNPSYKKNVEECSRVFRDRPESAMDRAIYWIEYVIRFQGAAHLRSAGRDMTWYSYLLLDVVAGVVLAGLVVICVCWFVVNRIIRILRQYQKSTMDKTTKKND